MARALRRACRDRGLPVTGHAALRTTPLALRRLGQGSPAACGECGGPQRRAPECLAARQTASHHAALTPRPPDGRLTPTRRLRQRYHELAGVRREPAPARQLDGVVLGRGGRGVEGPAAPPPGRAAPGIPP